MKLPAKDQSSSASDNNLIPMINVVFLLLVFFMVAGNIRVSPPLILKAPESTGGTQPVAAPTLHVASDGTLMLNDSIESMSTLPAALEELLAKQAPTQDREDTTSTDHENMTTSKLQDTPRLAIHADAQVSISSMRDILNASRDAGLSQVELLTTQVPAGVR